VLRLVRTNEALLFGAFVEMEGFVTETAVFFAATVLVDFPLALARFRTL
jgi:hypothetical protein